MQYPLLRVAPSLLLLLPILIVVGGGGSGLAGAPPETPLQTFNAAVEHLRAGRLPEAAKGFTEVLRQQPRNVGALGNLGVVYTRLEQWDDAIRVYSQALRLTPANPALHLNLGLAHLKRDDCASARPAFEKVLELKPGDAQARQLAAECWLRTGEVPRAIAELEALRPARDPAVLYLLSGAYLRAGRTEDGRAAIRELFETIPPAQANLMAGRAYYESTLFAEALECLEKASQLEPAMPGVALELGKTLVSLRRVDDARGALRDALKARPLDPEALYFLGALEVQEGSVEAGVPLLEKARELRPGFWGAWYYLGKAAAETDAARALPLVERAAELKPDERSVLYLLSRLYRRAGRAEEAAAAARRLADLEKAGASRGAGMTPP